MIYDLWDWTELSANVALPWSSEFIKKYQSKWHWDKNCFINYCFWDNPEKNYLFKIEIIEAFKEYIDLQKILANEKLYNRIFKQYMNEESIEIILNS